MSDDKKEDKGVFDLIEGFTAVDPAALAEFKQEMTQQVIPEIVKVVEERRVRSLWPMAAAWAIGKFEFFGHLPDELGFCESCCHCFSILL